MPIKLANTFVDFQCCHFLRKLKITPPIIQKVVWQKFENQKSEMYKIFIFSRRTLWNVTFFLETLFKGSKSSSKMGDIEKFENLKNLSKRFAKIWVLKLNFCCCCLVQFWRHCWADYFAPLTFGQGHLESQLILWSLSIIKWSFWSNVLTKVADKYL